MSNTARSWSQSDRSGRRFGTLLRRRDWQRRRRVTPRLRQHRDFARVWQKAEKIVFSRTLTGATTRNTRVERDFDIEAIRKLKRESERDIRIGGAELAGLALEADLVDECQLFLNPLIVGGGKPAFRAALRRNLELLETRRFGTGVIHLRYRIRGGTPSRQAAR